jgi:hypothetical protein
MHKELGNLTVLLQNTNKRRSQKKRKNLKETKLKSRTAPVAPRFAKRSKTKLSTSLQVSSETV